MSQQAIPKFSTAKYIATSTTAANLTGMVAGKRYRLTCSVGSVVKQGTNPTASKGDGSVLVAAGESLYLHGSAGDKVSVLALTGTGDATLVEVELV